MNTIKNIALFLLICLAGVWVAAQREKDTRKAQEKEPVTALEAGVQATEVVEASSIAQADPPTDEAPAGQPTPSQWYTLRRLSVVTDSGIFAIPAGSHVTLTEEEGQIYALHQGRKVPVTAADLTNSRLEAEAARPAVAVADAMPVEPTPKPVDTSRQTVSTRRVQDKEAMKAREAAVQALNQQIGTIKAQMAHEMSMLREAQRRGRASSRSITVDKLRKEMDALVERRRQLLSKN